MLSMRVDEICDAVQGRMAESRRAESAVRSRDTMSGTVTSVVTDSRAVEPGSLFVAIAGERVDGHDFLASAQHSGAIVSIVDHVVPDCSIDQIVVPDTVKALALLARHNLERRRAVPGDFDVIGITGSVGKTTTKDLLHHLLSGVGPTVAPVGSFNNEIGLPLTALKVGGNTRFLVAEMGANHIGEIAGLTRIAPPDVSVVLKVGMAHVGEFGSVENIALAKSELVRGLVADGTAVLNADDPRVSAMSRLAPAKVLWFGKHASERTLDMTATDISVDDVDRPTFTLHGVDGDQARVTLGIPGVHNVMNALAAATVASWYGMTVSAIAGKLQDVGNISPHRMALSSVDRHGVTFTLIDDSYNANPDSTKAGLDGLLAWHRNADHRPYRVAVLGAMLELGEAEIDLHRRIGAYASDVGVDAVIAVGGTGDEHLRTLARAVADGALHPDTSQTPLEVHWVPGIDEADHIVDGIARRHADTVVLLKGSHVSGLSDLAQRWTAAAPLPVQADDGRQH